MSLGSLLCLPATSSSSPSSLAPFIVKFLENVSKLCLLCLLLLDKSLIRTFSLIWWEVRGQNSSESRKATELKALSVSPHIEMVLTLALFSILFIFILRLPPTIASITWFYKHGLTPAWVHSLPSSWEPFLLDIQRPSTLWNVPTTIFMICLLHLCHITPITSDFSPDTTKPLPMFVSAANFPGSLSCEDHTASDFTCRRECGSALRDICAWLQGSSWYRV